MFTETYSDKDKLNDINQEVMQILHRMKTHPSIFNQALDDWEATCIKIAQQVQNGVLKMAVIGALKSGKSTFINSLVKGDYLARGAGAITSIITRIRPAQSLSAQMTFKTWTEVNADIEQAVHMLSPAESNVENMRFDIRNDDHRRQLDKILASLEANQLLVDGRHNMNTFTIAAYLKGYSTIQNTISTENITQWFSNHDFNEHRKFVKNESLAVYVHDILLEVDTENWDDYIEFSDCQGIDSLNPLHLTLIQEHLILTHLIIYVVSSRTGLRQADIRFLSMLKNMGLTGNIIFVLNCDIGEHESLQDVNNIRNRTATDIALIRPNPQIFTISALFNLLNRIKSDLHESDHLRMAHWKSKRHISNFCTQETDRLESTIIKRLGEKRHLRILISQMERLAVIGSRITDTIDMNIEIVSKKAEDTKALFEKLRQHQKKFNQMRGLLQTSVEGAKVGLKKELQKSVDRFFEIYKGRLTPPAIDFIRNYQISLNEYDAALQQSGFLHTRGLVFSTFKTAFNRYAAEVANPLLIKFVGDEEDRIDGYFKAFVDTFEALIPEVQLEFGRLAQATETESNRERIGNFKFPDVRTVKDANRFKMPTLTTWVRYSSRAKAKAVAKLGLYTLLRKTKKMLKKPAKSKVDIKFRAIKDGLSQLKQETEDALINHLKAKQEEVKSEYLIKLVDNVASELQETLMDRFHLFRTDLTAIENVINNRQIDRASVVEDLESIRSQAVEINNRLGHLLREPTD